MIVSCEKCHARYLLASLKLGTTGRTVRCGVCSHTWFQPSAEEKSADAQPSFQEYMDPIPEGVRPIPEGSATPSLKISTGNPKTAGLRDMLAGAIAASLVFLLILAILMSFHRPIVRMWPPAALAFSMVGLENPLPGEGLVIADVAATGETHDGIYRLVVTGKIVNTLKSSTEIPVLDIDFEKTRLPLSLDKKTIAGETEFTFRATFDHVDETMKTITVGFSGA